LNEFNEDETTSVITMKEGFHNEDLLLANPPSFSHNFQDEHQISKIPIENFKKHEEDNSKQVNQQITDEK